MTLPISTNIASYHKVCNAGQMENNNWHFTLVRQRFFALALLLFSSCSAGLLDTSSIRIANKTEHTVYCCFYHQRGSRLMRAGEPFILPEDNAVQVALPASRLLCSRVLTVSATKKLPLETTTTSHPFLVAPLRIGMWQPTDFTVHPAQHAGTPMVSETSIWHNLQEKQADYHRHTATFPFANQEATVTTQRDKQEAAFIAARREHTHKAQETLLGKTLHRPLRIGLCASGGGYRAMLATLGVLKGLEKHKILDTIDTAVGLSGSTWGMLSWLASKQSVAIYASDVSTRLGSGLVHRISSQYDDLAQIKKNKEMCGLPVSAIDLYGIGLSHTLIKPLLADHLSVTLPDAISWLAPDKHPYLVCTAATRHTPEHPYTWVGFSPFSVYQLSDNTRIPSWALNRAFCHGKSTNNTPPPQLGFCLGIFGSSFSISIRDAFERSPESFQRLANAILPVSWQEQITQAGWANTKITAAYIPNFSYGMDDSIGSQQKWLCLVDGGYLNNLPLYPLLAQHEEPFDLVIVIDSKREHDQRIEQVNQAYDTCKDAGYKVAPLTDEQVLHNSATLSTADEEHDTSVVYITLEPDETIMPGFNATTQACYLTPNLFYTPAQAINLVDFMAGVIDKHLPLFKQALAEVNKKIARSQQIMPANLK